MKRNMENVQTKLENRIRLAIEEEIKNPSSGTRSIRAFCKEENFSLTTVSEYLSQKRVISSDTLFRLLVTLQIDIKIEK